MAQIIKHRRGSLEKLTAQTSSLQKGELIIATGSSNLVTSNGSSLVFAAVETGKVEAVNRFLLGSSAPAAFSNSSYNGLVNGVPYYSSGNSTLYLLGSDANTIPNLVGNISEFSSSVSSNLVFLQNQISNLDSGSVSANLSQLQAFTSSATSRFNSLEAATSSYETKGRNIVSSSSDTANVDITISSGVISANLYGGVVSGSSQITYGQLTGLPTNLVSQSTSTNSIILSITNGNITAYAAGGVVSGSSQITYGGISSIPNNIVSSSTDTANVDITITNGVISANLLGGVVSGSTQVTALLPTGTVSSSAQVTSYLPSGVVSSSLQIGSGILSSSNTDFATYTASVNNQLSNLTNITGSYATTGSNTFYGTQIISGSTYITGNLIVIGSSSISNISASSVSIGTNTVVLNTFSPAVRFGGISVYDSGSTGGTGSLWWDSVNNHWVYEHPADSEDSYNSAMLISGPRNSGSLGNEIGLTATYFPVAVADDHIQDSNMTLVNGKVTITGMFEATAGLTGSLNGNADSATKLQTARLINGTSFDGTANITIPNLVSGSSQVTYGGLTGIPSNIVSSSTDTSNVDITISNGVISANLFGGVVSGSSQITYSGISAIPSGIVSGSSQITSLLPAGTVSGSSQITYGQISAIPSNIVSSSTNTANVAITITNGVISANLTGDVISGSSQIVDVIGGKNIVSSSTDTANVDINIVNGVISANLYGGVVSGSSQISYKGLSNLDANIVSASSNTNSIVTTISGGSISSYAVGGVVSGSSQITYSNISGIPANIVSSSAQVTAYLPTGVVSSSAQIGSGILSSSNTDFATYTGSVNSRLTTLEGTGTIQGVGTTNSPTFANLVLTGDLTVQGNTVTLNTTELVVEDKLITLASGSTNAAAANGAGIQIDGANASFTYDSTPDAWTFNKPLSGSAVTASVNIPGFGTSKRLAFRNTTGNIDFVAAPTTDGDLVQWNGTDFVMTNVIDGGTF